MRPCNARKKDACSADLSETEELYNIQIGRIDCNVL